MPARKVSKTLQRLAGEVGSQDSDLAFLRALLARLSVMIEDEETAASVVVQLNFEALRVMTMVRSITSGDAAPATRSLIDSLRVVK